MILELAESGQSDFVLTGDKDLLTLHLWRGISILTRVSFLEQVATAEP
jgi:predicted nucleic acid-binding protein